MSNMNNNNGSNTSLRIAADVIEHVSVSSAETADSLTKGRQGLKLQQLLQDDECFKKFVISELFENASYGKKIQVHPSNKEHNEFHIDVLSCINNVNSLEQFDKKLKTNQAYRNTIIFHMSKIGGINVKRITMAIMGRIIHCTLAKQYSWKGGKRKLQFCLLNGLVSAIICKLLQLGILNMQVSSVAADATEEDVIVGIKEFLRQSIGRAKTWEAKQQNERNLDEHISEAEEASTSNETDKGSDSSVTEDDTNKYHLNINKKRNSFVGDSDDDSL